MEDRNYAEIPQRFLAYFIDFVILYFFCYRIISSRSFYMTFTGNSFRQNEAAAHLTELLNYYSFVGNIILYFPIIIILYYTVLTGSSMQGTFGKRLTKIKVVDINGDRISYLRALGRSSSMFLSSFLFIGFFMAIFSKNKQALHDLMADTFVVKK